MGSIFGGAPKETQEQKDANLRQKTELDKLSAQEAQRVKAAGRRRSGRASLISGAETGVKSDTLG